MAKVKCAAYLEAAMYLDWGFAFSTLPIAVAAAVAFGVAEALSRRFSSRWAHLVFIVPLRFCGLILLAFVAVLMLANFFGPIALAIWKMF
jgi:hypothetical protein